MHTSFVVVCCLSIHKKESVCHVLILCIHKSHLSLKWNGKFTHNFFSVVQLIRGLFRLYFNGSSYKLLSNEGEIIESNKSLEEGSHIWFESTMWSYERRDWLKRWQISIVDALTEIVTTWMWCTVLHKTCTGLLDFQKLEKDLQCKEYLFWPLKPLGTVVAQWLRCCATNRKVAALIPAGVIGIFHWRKILPIALWPWGRHSL